MAKIREILGDEDLQILIDSGASDEKIKQLAKTKYNYFKEMKTLYKYNQVDDAGNIVEKKMDDVVDFIDEKANYKEKSPKDNGQSFLDRFNRTIDTNIANALNVTRYVADGATKKMGIDQYALKNRQPKIDGLNQFIETNRKKDEEFTKSLQSPMRQKESEKLNKELTKAKGVSETVSAGAKMLLDKAYNPSEWNVAGIAGDVFSPENLIPLGAGLKLAKGASKLKKVATGAGVGAVAGGASGGGYEFLSEKALGKSDEEAQKSAIVGGMAGTAMGAGFGGVGGYFSENAKPKIKETIKIKKAEAMSSENINDKIYADATGKEIPDDVLDTLLDNELLQLDEVEQSAITAKPIIKEISSAVQTPQEINALVAQNAPPTPKEISISMITNGQEVSPRFAGMRIRDALVKSIQNPTRTPREMYTVLKNEGFSDESANMIVQSYMAKDVTLYDNYSSEKISDIIDVEIIEKIQKLELKDERVRVETKDGERDAKSGAERNYENLDATRATDGNDPEPPTISGSSKRGDEAIRNDGQSVSKGGETPPIPSQNEGVGGHEAVGHDSGTVPRGQTDEVVSDENAIRVGSGLGKLEELKTHKKFEKHLKERENIKSTDIRYDNTQTAKGTLTEDGNYIRPTFEKNYLADFEFTKSDVKKIRDGKADEVTLQKLENDLYRYDNDPAYYEPEVKLEEKYDEIADIDDIDFSDWFTDKDPEIGDMIKKANESEAKATLPKSDESIIETKSQVQEPKTKGERKKINEMTEEIIKKPFNKITPEDKKILENYTGKGGLETGTKESLTQHYTDKKTVNAMYNTLKSAGVKFDRVLEPAVGSGNFLKGQKAKFTTVDIDKTNIEVVKRLYQDGEHILSGYEAYKPAEKFDLIISNVPFSEERGAGRLAYRPDIKALHDSFFIKALDDVRDDGVVAFITSKGVMDKANSKIRKEITSQADVIGAYRLPDSTFAHTNTNVITDVIFLQKRPKGVKSRDDEANKAFETSSKDEDGISMSDYYRQKPENVLGDMKKGIDPMYGKPAYLVTGDADLSKMKIDYEPYGDARKSDEAKAALPKKGSKSALSEGKKELLEEIKKSLDPALVEKYREKYKKHPEDDRGLKAYFKDDMDSLYELSSYFDKDFKPAEIFYQQARYSGSGKMEVNADSPLRERLKNIEDAKGIVEFKDFKEDLETLLDQGYAYIGDGKIQNDVLYYSGNIYKKIQSAENIKDVDVFGQISTLQEFIPTKKTLEELNFKGNEPWLLENGIKIYKIEKKSKWVKVPGGEGERKVYFWQGEFGDIFNNFLNNKKLISEKSGESETAFKRRLREAETGVKDTLEEIKQRAEEQRAEIEDIYNKKFNFYKSPDYAKLEYMISDVLAELPRGFSLRQTQKKFIIKSLYEGKGINAHDVGGGKTFAGIVLGRALKKKGIAKKPLYVVPSKVIKNWQKEILQLYPKAKIVNLGNLDKTTRTKKLFALSNQNADFVLISQEGFKQLKLPSDVEAKYARDLLDEHQSSDDLKGRALALQAEKIDMYLSILAKTNSDKRITIDKLGIDAIIADEARAFKNIGVKSSLARLGLGKPFGLKANEKGITLQSALAYDFRFKTRYISERNNNSNIYMLDATPTPNKPLELFTMLKHLDTKIFDEYNIKTDEDFVNQFLETGVIQQKDGSFKDGITGIKNVFELRSIMDRFIDRISMQDFKDKGYIDIPESKMYKHIIESSDENDIVFSDIKERLEESKTDKSKRKDVLGIYSNGVNASVDPRLYAKSAITELAYRTPENNKIDKVLQLVKEARMLDKDAGQIIFVDNVGHSMQHLDTNLHQEIKVELRKQGIKSNQIAIISGQEITNVQTGKEQKVSGNRGMQMKQDIVDAYNSGQIKIVIGTTKSAGEGMNIQKYTKDIYHLDLPWTPAEITQRNGRGVRYGNINKEVNIHYFFTQGSFDNLMFNTITKKQGWNDLIWDAKAKANLKIADSDSGGLPSADQIVLEMITDPVERKELELRLEHERLEENLVNIEDEVRYQKGRLRGANADIADLKTRIASGEREIKSGEINTKEMRELAIKATKSPLHKKKYNEKLQKAIELRQNILNSNKKRLEKAERIKVQTKKDLDTAKGDLFDGENKLERFEVENIDDRGGYKSGLEEC